MKQLRCPACDTQISKQGLLKLWKKTPALRNTVTEEELRREMAKAHPFIKCFNCDGPNNAMVRADLFQELREQQDVEGLDERNQDVLYTGFQ